MKAFAYVAYTEDGKRRAGNLVADSEATATAQLSGQGLYVSELRERAGRGPGAARRGRISRDLQAVFTRQMAVLLAAEMPVEAALEAVRSSGAGGRLDAVASRARAALLDGAPLAEALELSGAGLPPYYLASLRAGEAAGDLDGVFGALADHLDATGEDRSAIATALIYPAFVAAVSLLVCGILMVSVAPEIVSMFEITGRPLPRLTRVVMGASDWIIANALPLGLGMGGLAALWLASARVARLRAWRHRLVLRLPVAGRFLRTQAAVQYLRTLALVLSARHPVPDAVESAAGVLDIARFRTEADGVSRAVRQGESLAEALARLSVIPPVARQLVQAGEASVRLGPMTARAAQLVETALSTERKRIAAVLEPMLMMLVGAFVLVIVLAVLLPIFDLQAVVAG